MTDRRSASDSEQSRPFWLGFAKFAFILVFTVLVFVLAQSMKRHHFFRGALDHNNWREDRSN